MDLIREYKNVENESEGHAICNWCFWYSYRRIVTRTGGLQNKRSSGNHPNYSIIEIGKNTEKSSGDLKRYAVT